MSAPKGTSAPAAGTTSGSTGAFPLATWGEVFSQVRVLVRGLRGARFQLLLAIVLLMAGAAANVQVPRLLGRIVDAVIAAQSGALSNAGALRELGLTGLGLIAAAVAAAVLQATGFFLVSRQVERVIAALREQMVATALGLPIHEVEDAGSGDLVSRSTDDVAELSSAVTETVPVLSQSLFTVVATAIALVGIDWQFLLVLLVALPIYLLAGRAYLKVAPARYAAERASMAERAREILQAIHGRETVRAFGLAGRAQRRIGRASAGVVENGMRARLAMLKLQNWVTAGEFLLMATCLVVGFFLVRADHVTVGAVTAAALMLVRVRGPVLMLMRVLDTVQSAYASLARIVGVVGQGLRPVPAVGAPPASGEARMRNVTFSYAGAEPAVEGIDFEVRPGETVAIVGASGAGKTTVAALLAGLRRPDSGQVLIDGAEVTSLSDAERVSRLALISQEVHVFSGPLRDDLLLARPGADDEQLWGALRRVRASWTEELPRGLDTEIGARGLQLSPVAAQQLALARVLLVDPAIVVMDEATAEAGSQGAGVLEQAAEEITRGRSAVVIAHRLDQAARADRVVVMDGGQIVESGPHAELVGAGGQYARLWAAWRRGRGL